MEEDAELLRRYAAERSEAAFAELVRRHLDLVYSAALRRLQGDAHAAADVAQEVFAALARQAQAVARHRTLPPWLYTTTRNIAVDFVRTERRRRAREVQAQFMHEVNTLSAGDAWEKLRPILEAAMDDLSETDRAAIVLRFFARRSLADVGAALNLTEDAARMRVGRALEKLHRLLDRRGVTSSATALSIVLSEHVTVAAPSSLSAAVLRSALSAGSGGVASVSFFPFAPAKAAAWLLSAVLVGVTGAIAIAQWRAQRTAEAALAAEQGKLFSLGDRVAAMERRAKAAVRELAQRHPAAVAANELETAQVEKEVNGPFGPNPPGSRARGRAMMAAYPEIQRLAVARVRANLADRFGKFYAELGLVPAQIDAFEQIMMAGISSTFGSGDRTVTLDAAPPLSAAEQEARLKQLLGERGFARLREFQQSQGTRAAALASLLYSTDHPLAATQAAKFQHLWRELNGTAQRDQPPAAFWAEARARAAEFLSPRQLGALRRLEVEDEFNFARIQNQKLRTAGATR